MKDIKQLKVVITKTEHGYSVYDETIKSRIDLFPNTQEGYFRLMDYLSKYLMTSVCKTN